MMVAMSPTASRDRLLGDLDDERAEAILLGLVEEVKIGPEAAKAWVFLGLIQLNRLDQTKARAAFVQALNIDPTVELPATVSPKARHTFSLAERQAQDEAAAAATKAAEARARTGLALATAPSRVPAWILGGVAVGSAAGGVVLGVLSRQALLQANAAPEIGASQQLARTAGQRGLGADVLFGVAAAAAITSTILFFVSRTRALAVSVSFTPLAGGGYAAVSWGP